MAKLKLLISKDIVSKEIKRLLDGEIEYLSIEELSANTLEVILEGLGCEINDDLDMNGWQCDYWFTFVYNDKKYSVSGTAWDGSVYIEPTSIKGVKHYANDIVGARITMKESDPEYTGLVLAALKQAVDDGLLNITSIENNLPDPKKLPQGKEISDYAYATDSQLRKLAKAADAKLIRNKSKSGYLAIHINVDLSSPLFSCYKGVFDGYTGEIQIIGSDVEQLKDVEDLCYKLKDDKNAIRSEYKPFKTHFKTYYNDETKDAFEDYTYALYLAQRSLPPNSKRTDFFPSIEELGFEGKVPKELDFNYLRRLKEKCDFSAKLAQKQEEMKNGDKSSHSETIKTIKHNGNIKTVKSLISYIIKG